MAILLNYGRPRSRRLKVFALLVGFVATLTVIGLIHFWPRIAYRVHVALLVHRLAAWKGTSNVAIITVGDTDLEKPNPKHDSCVNDPDWAAFNQQFPAPTLGPPEATIFCGARTSPSGHQRLSTIIAETCNLAWHGGHQFESTHIYPVRAFIYEPGTWTMSPALTGSEGTASVELGQGCQIMQAVPDQQDQSRMRFICRFGQNEITVDAQLLDDDSVQFSPDFVAAP